MTGVIRMWKTALLSLTSSPPCLWLHNLFSQLLLLNLTKTRKFVPSVWMDILSAQQPLKTTISSATSAQSTSLAAHSVIPPPNAQSAMTASTCPSTKKSVSNPSISVSPLPNTMLIMGHISTANSVLRAFSSTLHPWNAKSAIRPVTPARTMMSA